MKVQSLAGKENRRSHLTELLLTKSPVLKVFFEKYEIVIQCDSSKNGLGSCLIMKDKPVSFDSKSLTNVKRTMRRQKKSY